MHSMRAWYILESKVAFESRNWLEFPGSLTCDGVLASSVHTSGSPALFTNEIFEENIFLRSNKYLLEGILDTL
jgi:hypothetical protein